MHHKGRGPSDEPCYSAVRSRGIFSSGLDQTRSAFLNIAVPIHYALVHSTEWSYNTYNKHFLGETKSDVLQDCS